MGWFFSLARVAGASFPGASSMVQLQAEADSAAVKKRLARREDPISTLHPDLADAARTLYAAVSQANCTPVHLTDEQYERFARPLAILEAEGFIATKHTFGMRFAGGIWIRNPAFFIYMCGLAEDPDKMDELVTAVDNAKTGTWLRGSELAHQTGLPLPTIRGVMQLYEARGLGLLSKTVGETNYYAKA